VALLAELFVSLHQFGLIRVAVILALLISVVVVIVSHVAHFHRHMVVGVQWHAA